MPKILPENRRLTEKQKKFIEEYYVNGKNGAQAAIAAGYAKTSQIGASVAYRLLNSDVIKCYMRRFGLCAKPTSNRTLSNRTFREFKNKRDAVENAKKEQEEKRKEQEKIEQEKIKEVENMFEWKVEKLKGIIDDAEANKQYSAMISAIAELNKMHGHYSPTKNVNIDLKVDTDMRKLKELSDKLLLEYRGNIEKESVDVY